MAQVNGLAEGLLAGFQVGNQYYNGKQDREYRAQQAEREQANSDRQFGLAQTQIESAAKRDERNFGYQQERDQVGDKRADQEMSLRAAAQRSAAGNAAASLNLRRQELAFQIGNQQRTQRLQEEQPIVNAFYEGVKTGNVDVNLLNQISKDNPLNPARFYGKDAIETAKQVQTVVPQVISGQMDYNDPQAISILNKTLQPYINRNIGEKVDGTDKTITKKELQHIGLSEDGQSVIPTLKVTYSDGSTALKPMTEGGSSHPEDDSVTRIPIANLQQELAGFSKVAATLNAPSVINALQPYIGGTKNGGEQKEYRQAVLDVQSDAAKAKAGINKDGLMTPEEVQLAESRIDQQAADRMQQVEGLFGRGQQQAQSSGAQTRPDVNNDQALTAAFSDEYKKQFGEAPDMSNPKDLEAYNSWKQVMTKPRSLSAPVAAGPSVERQQQDSSTAQSLREMQRQAQALKTQQ